MIRANELQEKLLHLVGWQQSYDTSHIKIAESLTQTESGLYFQQAHPLITLSNLKSIAPDFENIKHEPFSLKKYYTKGDIVSFLGKVYRCKQAIYGCSPDGKFSPVNLLEDYNFSFEDENPFNGWNTISAVAEVIHPGYDSNTAVKINGDMSKTAQIGLRRVPALEFKANRRYKFQVAVRNPSAAISGLYVRFDISNNNTLLEYNRPVALQDWDDISYFKTFQNSGILNHIVLGCPSDKEAIVCDALSIKDVTDEGAPLHIEDYWEELDLFSDWLEQKTKSSIQKMAFRLLNEKLVKAASKNIIENKVLFDGTSRITDIIRNRNRLVGFEVIPVRAKGVTTKINRIGLQFTTPGKYTIYIMHSSMLKPVYTLQFTRTKANSIEWFTADNVYLPYESASNGAGGSWYICYLQSELPEGSQAIRKDRDWSKGPCQSCSRREFELWKAWSKYIEIHPFNTSEEQVDAVKYDDSYNNDFNASPLQLWDIENNQYTYDTNYGLNLDITVSCDITDFLIEQRALLSDVLMKQVACDILREFVYNPNVRTNRNSINASRSDILQELDGDTNAMQKSGLSYQLDQAYKALDISTRGLDRICLPCANNGIKYRSI